MLAAEDADHGTGDEEVNDDNEDRRDDDGLRSGFADALGAALGVHAVEAADGGNDEAEEERLGDALNDIGVDE